MPSEAVALRPGAALGRRGFAGGTMLSWAGPADTPPVLLLHGAASGAWVWAEGFAAHLAQRHTCAALDFPRDRTTSLNSLVRLVGQALDSLGRPALIVAHSLGGLIAQRLLADRRVAGAALLAPVPPEGLLPSNARLAWADFGLWSHCARMTDAPGTAPDSFARALFGPGLPREAVRRHLRRLGGESPMLLWEAQMPQPIWPAWLLQKPLLVTAAGEDRLIARDAVARCAAWHGATLEVQNGAGHLMMLDAGWERLADRLLGWASRF
jgi:pimeloyl-ACP methyl ester carboxylesterase